MQKKKYYINVIFMILILIAVFYVLLKDQDLVEIWDAAKNARSEYVAAAIVAAIFFVLLQALAMEVILHSLGEKAGMARCTKYAFIGLFFNAITPSASGGQPMQVLYMKEDKINMGASSVTLLFWTIIYKIVLVVIEGWIFLFYREFALQYLGKYVWLFVVGISVNVVSIILYSIIVFSKNGAKNIAYFVTWLLHKLRVVKLKRKEKIEKKLDKLLLSYQEGAVYMRTHVGTAVIVFLVTLVLRIVFFSITWFVYRALGLNEFSCLEIIILQSFVAVCIDILPFPGGVGVNEGFFATLFAPVMGKGLAVSAMLLSRGVSFYALLVLSAFVTMAAMLEQTYRERCKAKQT